MKPARGIAMFKKSKPERGQTSKARIPLSTQIVKRKWDAVVLALTSTPGEIEIDENGAINQDNIIHFALRFHAPLSVVQLLSKCYPECMNKPDATGKFCVHVAAKYSAHPEVMAYVISKNPAASGVPDTNGKCPIHYVAEFYPKHSIRYQDQYQTTEELMLEVVRLLKQAAPQSFNLEDEDERNPIEIALENDVGVRVIKMMQRTARDDWREMKQSSHGMKHDVLAKNLERSAQEARNSLLSNASGNDLMRSIPRREQRISRVNAPLKRSFTAKSA